jgi:hypothetical protein
MEKRHKVEKALGEEEGLQEISKKTLGSYIKKAVPDAMAKRDDRDWYEKETYKAYQVAGDKKENESERKRAKRRIKDYSNAAARAETKHHKRREGIERATDRLTKEDTDLQELSKKTLGSYVKQATHDVATRSAATRGAAMDSEAARKAGDYRSARKHADSSDRWFAKSWNRRKGIAKAVDRLTKD